MSAQSIAALYGVFTFVGLALVFAETLHFLAGWPLVPEGNRLQGTLTLAWYVLTGVYARAVSRNGARGASYGQALEAGIADLGAGIRSIFYR